MTSTWIAKNPTLNIRNAALAVPMSDHEFEELMRSIVHVYIVINHIPS